MSAEHRDVAELYLAAIVESSDDAIVSKNVDGIITSWNRAAERMFGYSSAEAVGRSIRLIIPADRQSEEDEVLRRIRAGLTVEHFETVRRRKDGTEVPISITVSPIRDATGTVIGFSKIARDVSDRKRAEAALVQAEARQNDLRQRLLALVSASGSLLGSPRVQDVQPATLRLARQLLPADAYALWRFDAPNKRWHIGSYAGISEQFAGAMMAVYRGWPVAADGSLEPFVAEDVRTAEGLDERREAYAREGIRSVLAIPLAISGRATASLVFYYRTPHRFSEVEIETARALGNLAAAAIRTAELHDEQRYVQQQTLFLAQAGEALAASFDYRDTLKTLARLAVPHIADWCAVDIVGDQDTVERLTIAHADPDRPDLADVFQRRHPTGADSAYRLQQVLQTGTSVLVDRVSDDMLVSTARDDAHLAALRRLGIASSMCVPLRTRQGVSGAITFLSAESGRVYTASDLRFAENVADRAATAIETARAYEEARQANRLKDEFLATLSHELRTPLNAILGYVRLLRTGIIPTDKHDAALETIQRNASSLTQIVEDVLDVSRIVSAKLRLTVERVQLGTLLRDAITTMRPGSDAKGLQIHEHIEEAASAIAGDAERLRQVFANLLSNAVKFTPSGGQITVTLRRMPSHAEILVSDTGRGIPAEFLPYVFDRFRQADSRFTREHGGLGLGLSIARHIVELHGGTIRAESAGENRGATFRILLPVRSEVIETAAAR